MTVTREWLAKLGVTQWIDAYEAMEKRATETFEDRLFENLIKLVLMPDYIFIHAIQHDSDNTKSCESHKNFENIAYFLGNTNFSKEEQEGGTIIKFTCEVCKQEIYFKRKTEKTLLNK